MSYVEPSWNFLRSSNLERLGCYYQRQARSPSSECRSFRRNYIKIKVIPYGCPPSLFFFPQQRGANGDTATDENNSVDQEVGLNGDEEL